jgi:hypothetical protein
MRSFASGGQIANSSSTVGVLEAMESRPLAAMTPRLLRSRDSEAATHYNEKSAAECRKIVDVFATACDWLWGAGYQPIFVPMNSVAPDDDREAARLVLEKARCRDHCLLIDESIRPRVAPAVYAQCDLSFVAVHGCDIDARSLPDDDVRIPSKHLGMMRASEWSDSHSTKNRLTQPPRRECSGLITNRGAVRSRMLDRLLRLRGSSYGTNRANLDLKRSDRRPEITDSIVGGT